ncbi:MAG: hypothetical protein VYB22_09310, partial [Pseudomonadota bacterium]|nr:hypothetical protein [Pseudomonadota bacterium]
QKVEQKASNTKDKGEKAALKKQVTKAKTVLRRLTSIDKKLSTSTMAKALTALGKAKAARDAADKALLTLNVQVTVATAAVRNATAELDITTAELIDARVKLDQVTVSEQLANARSAIAESETDAAKKVLKDATAAEKAAKASVTATTSAATKAGTGRIAASKALVKATQQATDSVLTYRAAVKTRDESDAKVKMAKSNVNKASNALADAQKIALQQRGFADKAKQAMDELSLTQQKKAQDRVTAATAAITKAQADMVSANELLKSIEAELATLVQTVLQAEQSGAAASAIIKTLEADAVASIKLAAEKNLLMELTRKMVESFVNVNQKWATDKATAANTALTQAKTNKIAADKALMMAKLKVADAVTVAQKAEQAMRNAEKVFKVAEMNLAKAQGEQAMAEKLAEEKMKQAT